MKPTIMVVDDDHAILEMMTLLLEKMGYDYVTVDDGIRALEMIKESTPDIILLDVMMTPINGWEFLARLRGELGLRKVPVLFFTAFPFIEDKINITSDPQLGLLQKPVSYKELKESIGKVLASQ